MKLELLPRGITGFFEGGSEPPGTDPKLFKAACYDVARGLRASVEMVDALGPLRSYFPAVFGIGDTPIAALCHRIHPYLGFVPAASLPLFHQRASFLSGTALETAFANGTAFHPLDAAFLNGDLRPEMLTELAACELREIRYWKPSRVGDLIFNFWD